MQYKVLVVQEEVSYAEVVVEADNEAEAKRIVYESTADIEFKSGDINHEVLAVHRL